MAYTNYGLTKGLAYKVPWMQMAQQSMSLWDRQQQNKLREENRQWQMRKWESEQIEFGTTYDEFNEAKYNSELENSLLPPLSDFLEQNPNYMYNSKQMLQYQMLARKVGDNQTLRNSAEFKANVDAYLTEISKDPNKWSSQEAQIFRKQRDIYRTQEIDGDMPIPKWGGVGDFDGIKLARQTFGALTRVGKPTTWKGEPAMEYAVTDESMWSTSALLYNQNPYQWQREASKTTLDIHPIDLIYNMGKNFIADDQLKNTGGEFNINLGGVNEEPVDWFDFDFIQGNELGTEGKHNDYVKYSVNHSVNGGTLVFESDKFHIRDKDGNYSSVDLPQEYTYEILAGNYVVKSNETDRKYSNFSADVTLGVSGQSTLVVDELVNMHNMINNLTDTKLSYEDGGPFKLASVTQEQEEFYGSRVNAAIALMGGKQRPGLYGPTYYYEINGASPALYENQDEYNDAKGNKTSQKAYAYKDRKDMRAESEKLKFIKDDVAISTIPIGQMNREVGSSLGIDLSKEQKIEIKKAWETFKAENSDTKPFQSFMNDVVKPTFGSWAAQGAPINQSTEEPTAKGQTNPADEVEGEEPTPGTYGEYWPKEPSADYIKLKNNAIAGIYDSDKKEFTIERDEILKMFRSFLKTEKFDDDGINYILSHVGPDVFVNELEDTINSDIQQSLSIAQYFKNYLDNLETN